MKLKKNMFVFEMANNHEGSVEHGLKIISEMQKISEKYSINGVIKFQFRDLNTFIPKNSPENSKFIDRFRGAALDSAEFKELINFSKKIGLKTMCTPFDEESVNNIVEMDIDIIKIASCSAQDWMLLDKVTKNEKPIICSTGGLNFDQIDSLYEYLKNNNVDFSLMHCVSVYPSSNAHLNLNCLDTMIRRYPDIHIGYSTHEKPDNLLPISVAVAKGATIFERHVGIPFDSKKLNHYSSTPEQVEKWIKTALEAIEICGNSLKSQELLDAENEAMYFLKRGVYAKENIISGEAICDKIYPAMRVWDGQYAIEELNHMSIAKKSYSKDEPLSS
ncbi:N-acetylneuraminate synthase family protein [bacterium]|nr:N-acetylneuraminate synthase family protein [bacterium]